MKRKGKWWLNSWKILQIIGGKHLRIFGILLINSKPIKNRKKANIYSTYLIYSSWIR